MLLPTKEMLLQSIPAELPPIIPLTTNASSWLLHLPRTAKPPNRQVFRQVFQTHPPDQHALQLYGKRVLENRYSQMYVIDSKVGATYKYSGVARPCHCCDPSLPHEQWILNLCHICNVLYSKLLQQKDISRLSLEQKQQQGGDRTTTIPEEIPPSNDSNDATTPEVYNCCLVNWYHPHHNIGLHADDERELNLDIPIVSVSWGGPRRFVLRPKPQTMSRLHPKQFGGSNAKSYELLLRDGDIVVMGGKCQQEFKHEIPKVRKMDGAVGERISWTIRSMHTTTTTQNRTASPSKYKENQLGGGTKRNNVMAGDEQSRIKREKH